MGLQKLFNFLGIGKKEEEKHFRKKEGSERHFSSGAAAQPGSNDGFSLTDFAILHWLTSGSKDAHFGNEHDSSGCDGHDISSHDSDYGGDCGSDFGGGGDFGGDCGGGGDCTASPEADVIMRKLVQNRINKTLRL